MKKNQKYVFWLLFFIFNLGLFLPSAVLGHSNFFEEFFERSSLYSHITFFFNRASDDPFRISLDLLLLLWAAYLIGPKRKSISILVISCSYVLLFFYVLYAGVFRHLYFFKPIFSNDVTLLKYGLLILFEESVLALVAIVVFLVAFAYLCFKGVSRIMNIFFEGEIYKSKVLLVISLFAALSLFRYYFIPLWKGEHFKFSESVTIQLLTNAVLENATRSIALTKALRNFDLDSISQSRKELLDIELQEKPNIYVLFIESYGEVAYELPEVRERYLSALESFEDRILANGIHMASSFSESPVNGGASWLSYASFINGLKINNQGLYQRLVHSNTFQKTPNLFKWLQTQDYRVFYLAPMRRTSYSPDLETYTRFYGVDHWISAKDFEHFEGQGYGWNAPPPDEYALNFSYQKYIKDRTEPFVFFYLTKNSHTPFLSPKSSTPNWETLNYTEETKTPKSSFFDKPTVADYAQSIEYQLDYLSAFIEKNTSGNDIIMLVGDHQPPIIAPVSASFNTMAHVISRDSTFIKSWYQQGFQKGMLIDRHVGVTHQSLLWILTAAMENNYGTSEEK